MSDTKISLRLTMATLPGDPVQPIQRTAVKKRSVMSFYFRRTLRQILVLALIILLSIGCYYIISRYFVQSVQVVGISMVPTLAENNHYLLNRWAYHDHDPRTGDVVVLRDPQDHGFSVKRIIATGGQAILIKDGKVFVNGKEFKEPYLLPHTYTFTYSKAREQFIMCGKDQYFVLGDNRQKSLDSRAYGPVPRANILGLVLLR
jgi:signal peptidase I